MKNIPNPGLGVIWAIAIAFPLTALCALLFRFPLPLAGYRSGPSAVPASLLAALFYGSLGGFVVLAVLGALSGMAANKMRVKESGGARTLTKILATGAAGLYVLTLAMLDKIIGPW